MNAEGLSPEDAKVLAVGEGNFSAEGGLDNGLNSALAISSVPALEAPVTGDLLPINSKGMDPSALSFVAQMQTPDSISQPNNMSIGNKESPLEVNLPNNVSTNVSEPALTPVAHLNSTTGVAAVDLEGSLTPTFGANPSLPTISSPSTLPLPPTSPQATFKKKTKRRKRPRKKDGPATKPIDLAGFMDDLEIFQGVRSELNERIPWFRENPIPNFEVKHINAPSDLDWDDGKAVQAAFPPWKLDNGKFLGTRQIPKCFLLDSKSVPEKLAVVNWWKNLSKDQQTEVASKENIHRFYRAPMRSNSPYKFWHDVPESNAFYGAGVSSKDIFSATSSNDQFGRDGPNGKGTRRHNNMEGAPIILKKPSMPVPGFRQARNCQDLSLRFNLSVDQLYCARIEPNTPCCVETCKYPAFSQNRNFCCIHKQNWWPRTGLEHYQKRRGHFLLGPEYAVRPTKDDIPSSKAKVRPVPCGCSDKVCEGIGWSADMARMPKGFEIPSIIIPNTHRDKDRPLRLAPWHFPPQYRMQLPDGTWKLLLEGMRVDNFPPPDYDPRNFLKEAAMVKYQTRKSAFLVPDWVHPMRRLEEGPMTLDELQQAALVQQRDELLQSLVWQSVQHQELTQEHQLTEIKLEEMKKTHVHKRSIKRSPVVKPATPNKAKRLKHAFVDSGDHSGGDKQHLGSHGLDPSVGRFRPVNDLLDTGEMSGGDDDGQAHAINVHNGRMQGQLPIQQYRDETAALHEGAQAIQYLQHQATTPHLQHPHHAPPPPPQQQHNSAFYQVNGDPDLTNNVARVPPPQPPPQATATPQDLTGMRRWNTFGGYR